MVCPYCEQDKVIVAKIKRNGKKIYLCEECDTVWEGKINLISGIDFDLFMKNEGCEANWSELEV